MLALILATLVAQAAAAPEPFPFTPEAEKLADTGYDLLTNGKAAEALVPVRELTRIAPDNPRAHRLLGMALEQNGDHDGAEKELTRAIDLKVDEKRLPSTHGLRARARAAKNDSYGARFDIDTAIRLAPGEPDAHAFSAVLYLRAQQWSKAESDARKAVELAPDSGFAHALLASALVEQREHAASRAETDKARALGFDNTKWLDALDETNTRELRKHLLWQVPLLCLVVMAAALLVLYVAGAALSRAQVGSLATLHPHMLRGEQTPGERFVLRLYLGVLWFGTIFFYVSVPAMVVLSLAVGVGLVYLMFTSLSQIPLKVVAILLIAGLGGVWAVLRGLFLSASADDSAKEITGADEPGLFAALGEVAEVAGTRRVDRVYLELGAEAGVRESGGAWGVLLGRGERVLHLGFWTLQGLTITELKAILAHEYGHFSHGETRLTPVVSRIVNTLVGMLQRMVALGWYTWVNPVYWYLRIYFQVFLTASAGHSRRRELLADRAAALGYGGDAFGRALRKAIENDAYFGQKAGTIAVLLRMRGNPCTAIYRALQAGNALVPAKLREGWLRELLERKPGEFDSHPPPNDRIARVAGVSGEPRRRGRAGDFAPARRGSDLAASRDDPAIADRRAARRREQGGAGRPHGRRGPGAIRRRAPAARRRPRFAGVGRSGSGRNAGGCRRAPPGRAGSEGSDPDRGAEEPRPDPAAARPQSRGRSDVEPRARHPRRAPRRGGGAQRARDDDRARRGLRKRPHRQRAAGP